MTNRIVENAKSIGAVVLNYNNADETYECVKALLDSESIDAIEVVDNCSTDGSRERLQKRFDGIAGERHHLYLDSNSHNEGYARGNNFGVNLLAKRIRPDYILIMNPDVRIDGAVIDKMREFLDVHEAYSAVAPIVQNARNEVCLSAWRLPDKGTMHLCNVGYVFPFLPNPCAYRRRMCKGNETLLYSDVDVLPGSLFLIRMEDFLHVGGFDRDTFLYGEEKLLFAKVKASGKKCALLVNQRYLHKQGTTIEKTFTSTRKRFSMLLNSNVVYCRKVLGASETWIRVYKICFKASINVFVIEKGIKNVIASFFGKNQEQFFDK